MPACRDCCSCCCSCATSLHIQYKYVVRNKDGSVVRWQEGANVSLDLPGGNAAELALDVEDSWNKSKQVRTGPRTRLPHLDLCWLTGSVLACAAWMCCRRSW